LGVVAYNILPTDMRYGSTHRSCSVAVNIFGVISFDMYVNHCTALTSLMHAE